MAASGGAPAGAGLVELNVGGRRFCTSRQTLAWVPDSFFSSLLSGRISSLRDETGAVSEPPSPLLGTTGASPGPRPQASRTLPFPSSRSSSTGTPISSPPSSTSSAAKNWTSGGATSRCCCTKPSSTGSRLSFAACSCTRNWSGPLVGASCSKAICPPLLCFLPSGGTAIASQGGN